MNRVIIGMNDEILDRGPKIASILTYKQKQDENS